ncbi:hypothetical protein SAMN03159341_111179 [Paenibacillus sp. 1_12]|uniref:hypothetical protein n=1 Tax=Paenibacillus sp. 1_12 TaxID=1566278 RepID=UPI0008F0D520|nr:hypothetical protein [Paenibacillus sp. 1_12]SFL90674.1 hypothetical protein SAMN03159341_111179 [Paenibacillus sp. 1_12]
MRKQRSTHGTCELCKREQTETTLHHLTPKEYGGSFMPTAELCIVCHKQIHALFTNAELAASLHTLEALQADEQMSRFLRWVRKQPSSTLPRIRKSKHVRKNK